ncbi:hypothetical protein RF11_12794 [Thelohanellus kitauei]|uniref:EGF-like domain-containing protein n=1 Tax=Thelohanellus kitauei TaxID=669202 RepID=A0A0C2M2R7_THEKT|nr:hypothetical protein RF11_12794 [Thelohanellus kitauei]
MTTHVQLKMLRNIFNELTVCKCPSGYRGEFCEEEYCSVPCDPDHGICIGNDTCECTSSYKTGPFCNITTCNQTNNSCQNGEITTRKEALMKFMSDPVIEGMEPSDNYYQANES